MSDPLYMYCWRCRKSRLFVKIIDSPPFILYVLTLCVVPILLLLVRYIFLPHRCIVCYAPERIKSYKGVEIDYLPKFQSQSEINNLLSPFDVGTINYSSNPAPGWDKPSMTDIISSERVYFAYLKEYGKYNVGFTFEKILHVAPIALPDYLFVRQLFALVYTAFSPITFWFYRQRRSDNPNANWIPVNWRTCGRIILTDKRLVIYDVKSEYHYNYHSLPLDTIREVRQIESTITIYMIDPEYKSISVFIGDELGVLLGAMHKQKLIKVRNPPLSINQR